MDVADPIILGEFEISDPGIYKETVGNDGDAWTINGTVVFKVVGYEAGKDVVSVRTSRQVYGSEAGTRLGVHTAAELSLDFKNAKTRKDALKQAASQLKQIADLLLKQADDLLAK